MTKIYKCSVLLFCFFLFGCLFKASKPTSILPLEVYGLLQNDFAVLIDVREKEEVTDGMAQKALWFPSSKISENNEEWKSFLDQLPKAKKIVFYCAGGGRAGRAAELLSRQHYDTANMGGYDDWVDAKLPTFVPNNAILDNKQ